MNRKRFCISLTLMLATAGQVIAANTVTFYRDGALFQREATAQKGVSVIPLTADILENTISVVPATGTTILSVETVRNDAPNRTEKELELLAEQRKKLKTGYRYWTHAKLSLPLRPNLKAEKHREKPKQIRIRCTPSAREPTLPLHN